VVALLLEMVVGAADKGVGFVKTAVDVRLILGIPNVDEDGKAFGHKLHLVTEAFDQHAGVALDLLDPFIQSRIHFFEAGIEPLLLPFESTLKVLNEFLIHTASAVPRIGWAAVFVNKTPREWKRYKKGTALIRW
jgi:hypothetical protein